MVLLGGPWARHPPPALAPCHLQGSLWLMLRGLAGLRLVWSQKLGLPQWGAHAPRLPGPFQRHGARSKGPSTEDQQQAWKECKQEDIFKLFPALAIRALEARGPEVSPALTKKETVLGFQRAPPHSHPPLPPHDPSWGLREEVLPPISSLAVLLLQDSMLLMRGPPR